MRREEEARETRQADFQTKLQLGREALQAKRYDEAVTVLTEACRLMPEDDAALGLLSQAKEGKRQADYEKAMIHGRGALTANNYQAALAAFAEALELIPGDKEATALCAEVEFRQPMQQGSAAMEGKRYDEAVKAFAAATQLRPEDQAIRNLLQQAQEALRQQIKAEYDQAMSAGRESLNAKNYQAALDSFTQALRLVPGDEKATTLSTEAEFNVHWERGRKAFEAKQLDVAVAALETAARLRPDDKGTSDLLQQVRDAKQKQTKAEYDRALTSGKSALSFRRYNDAISSFQQAQRLMPLEAEAGRLLTEAESQKRSFEAEEKRKQTKAEYDRALTSGKSALFSRRYNDAISSFQQAERLMPAEAEAARLLMEAESQNRSFEAEVKRKQTKAEYDRALTSGKSALFSRRYNDAISSFQQAQRLMPTATEAGGLLREAESKKREAEAKKRRP